MVIQPIKIILILNMVGRKKQPIMRIRKFAKETATPGLFDLYVNVRGNTQKDIPPLDIVFVADWSGSMNEEKSDH